MRVLHLVAIPQLTGAAEPTLDMVTSLRRLGVEVELRIDTKLDGNLQGLLEQQGLAQTDPLTLSTRSSPAEFLRDLQALRCLLPEFDIAHVHLSHDHALALTALRLVPRARRPRVVRTVHAARVLGPSGFRRFALKSAAGVTVACRAHADHLVQTHGIDRTRILEMIGAIDPARFHPDGAARARVRGELGLDDAQFAVGCVARFKAGRKHDVLLDAVARARQEIPHLRLVLIGHGELQDELQDRAAQPDLDGAVLFAGYRREDLNDYLVALDAAAWLVPGNDATCRAVLQAMAAGLPVIGGRRDAIADLVVQDQTGTLVDPDDADSVRDGIIAMARSKAHAAELGQAGLDRALKQYTHDARAQELLAFYERILAPS